MNNDAWYDVVGSDIRLTQGDMILDCPVISWESAPVQLTEPDALKSAVTAVQADVVVMTQACDLEHSKVRNVILCPHILLSEYRKSWKVEMESQSQNPTEKAWRGFCDDVADGFVWNLSFLNKGKVGEWSTEHRIVDFHDVFTIPKDFLESLLKQRGKPRWRLRPPYREHLSQAFARFFMRVGLPVPVAKAW